MPKILLCDDEENKHEIGAYKSIHGVVIFIKKEQQKEEGKVENKGNPNAIIFLFYRAWK